MPPSKSDLSTVHGWDLQAARIRRGPDREEVAQAMGVSVRRVAQIENARRITTATLTRYFDAIRRIPEYEAEIRERLATCELV